jgi:hypothetical protein
MLAELVEPRTVQMLHRVRRIERREDAYVEHVVDPRTG